MRTTVTLDPDTAQIVRRRMRERGMTFKEALNDVIRSGAGDTAEEFQTPTASLGRPSVNLDRALQVAGDLEDEDLVRKERAGS
ncbi:antitoxin [Egibacter rhizosphaerae]|uniref:Antitoxin n=1 Tax=Egibacter rhizosphaerae TaxID=1670831 RepID=A0A411YB74_9ACTN|nr:antitoxin [Egibacter rhizosphaerae]QBI18446.1 antitoxin [Egibacter rhizosphaerae]